MRQGARYSAATEQLAQLTELTRTHETPAGSATIPPVGLLLRQERPNQRRAPLPSLEFIDHLARNARAALDCPVDETAPPERNVTAGEIHSPLRGPQRREVLRDLFLPEDAPRSQ